MLNKHTIVTHLLVVGLLFLLAVAYVPAVLQGKILLQHDMIQGEGAAKPNKTFYEQTGHMPLWADNMFSGMPAYMVYMDSPNSLTVRLGRWLFFGMGLEPANLLFWAMLSMYVVMLLLGAAPSLAVLAAVAYAFTSYNIINIEAGHISKVIAVATLPGVLGGVILAYEKKRIYAVALLLLFAGLHMYGNHIQISYYGMLMVAFYLLGLLYVLGKKKRWKYFFWTSLLVLGCTLVVVSTFSTRLLTTYEYSKYSIRGSSELSASPTDVVYSQQAEQNTAQKPTKPKSGLDMDYAFNWSYGKLETLTLIIPHFMGGSSTLGFDNQSQTYQTMLSMGVPAQVASSFAAQLPAYWGEQPFTSGPAYLGAAWFFVFVFVFLTMQHWMRWWALISLLLLLMVAWGKNLLWFNAWMFHYFPLFNKFRAVTMALTLLPLPMAFLLAYWWHERRQSADIVHWQAKAIKQLRYSTLLVGGGLLLIAVLGGSFLDFSSSQDQQLVQLLSQAFGSQEPAQRVWIAIKADRQSMMQADAWRSLIFLLMAAALLFWFVKKPHSTIPLWGLVVVVLVDLWGVDRRYLNQDDFRPKYEKERFWAATPADRQILQDTSYYRVLNLSVSPFNDATTSYWHRSVGGYHGAKLRIYQDLIEAYLSRQAWHVYDMLNTKYIIISKPEGGRQVQQNDSALGPAWWVSTWRFVENADEELRALATLTPSNQAVLRAVYAPLLEGVQPRAVDSTEYIRLVYHQPDRYVYEYSALTDRLAIFSEIYYPKGWRATVDGHELPIMCVNYVLRGLRVPAGNHVVEFRFEPDSYRWGQRIDLWASVLWLGLLLACILPALYHLRKV